MFGENMLGREHDLVEVAASLQTRKVDRPKGDGRNCLVGINLASYRLARATVTPTSEPGAVVGEPVQRLANARLRSQNRELRDIWKPLGANNARVMPRQTNGSSTDVC